MIPVTRFRAFASKILCLCYKVFQCKVPCINSFIPPIWTPAKQPNILTQDLKRAIYKNDTWNFTTPYSNLEFLQQNNFLSKFHVRGQSLKTRHTFLSILGPVTSFFSFGTKYFKTVLPCAVSESNKPDHYIHSCVSYSSFRKALLIFCNPVKRKFTIFMTKFCGGNAGG